MKTWILVVEDDAAFGMMIQTWLKRNGYEVVLSTRYEQDKMEISSKHFVNDSFYDQSDSFVRPRKTKVHFTKKMMDQINKGID